MLDQIEHQIANRLAQKHNYPYAQNIYINIFRSFSHFPIMMADIGMNGPGDTITYLALVVYKCFEENEISSINLYQKILKQLKPLVTHLFPQDCTVETFLGTILFFFHPSGIKNQLGKKEIQELFDDKQLYEFHLKKKTILINII